MGEFLSYSIVSGVAMLAMYLAYRVFLARENQHVYNRVILLLIYAVSFSLIPLSSLFERMLSHSPSQATMIADIDIVDSEIIILSQPIWGTVLIWIFIAGMAIVAIKTCLTWLTLIRIIRRGTKIKQDGYTLVLTDNGKMAPFSWMNYIVINHRDYNDALSAITVHEMKHVACRHWVDLLIAQIVCIVNWFNPAAWLMRDELMLVHEYQADMAVIDEGFDPQQYQMLLIKKAVGSRLPSLANSLNHSKLKKRITMMYKQKSGAGRKLKALALVPMVALTLGIVSVPAVRAAVSTISCSETSFHKGNQKPPTDKVNVKVFRVKDFNNYDNETTITIKAEGCGNHLTVSGGTFTTKGKTYQAKSLECSLNDGEAIIVAKFPFTSEYDNTSMTLLVNGEKIPFILDEFFSKAQSVYIDKSENASESKGKVVLIHGNQSTLTNDMEIFFDGKKISESEMKHISPKDIASISVDKNSTLIQIYSVDAQPNVNYKSSMIGYAGEKVAEEDIKEEVSPYKITDKPIAYHGKIITEEMKESLPNKIMAEPIIYLDGKRITEAEMNTLSPEEILSITVDKGKNEIRITPKIKN